MNASELIELLRKHPKACAALSVEVNDKRDPPRDSIVPWMYAECAIAHKDEIGVYEHDLSNECCRCFRRWLVGACVEWCDAHKIEVHREATESVGWYWFDANTLDLNDNVYPSRLHAMLAAMEAHDRLAP